MKQKIIKKIKKIINNIGNISVGEIQSNYSQVYKQISKDHFFLVEGYNLDNISVVEYVHEIQTNEFYANYEELNTWQLKEVLAELKYYYKENNLTNIKHL